MLRLFFSEILVICLHLEYVSLGLAFIIDIFSFQYVPNHPCSLNSFSILRAKSLKIVMKPKTVMFFILWVLFLKM